MALASVFSIFAVFSLLVVLVHSAQRPSTYREILCPFDDTITASPASPRPPGTANKIFDAIEPVVGAPDTCQLESVDAGSGDKHLCMGMFPPLTAPSDSCAVVSLGSNEKYDYEASVYDLMPCEIHVFDCAVENAAVPEKLAASPRFFSHNLCVGAEDDTEKSTATWKTIAAIASGGGLRRILSVKIAVDGWESAALAQLANSTSAEPMQISVRLHLKTQARYNPSHSKLTDPYALYYTETPQAIRDLVASMRAGGYLLADRNDHPHCDTCSDVLFLRVNMYGLMRPIFVSPSQDSSVTSYDESAPLISHVLALYQKEETVMKNCSSSMRFLMGDPPCPELPIRDVLLAQAIKSYEEKLQYSSLASFDSEHTLAVRTRLYDEKNELDRTLIDALTFFLNGETAINRVVIQEYAGLGLTTSTSQDRWAAACRLETSIRMLQKIFGDRVVLHVPQTVDEDMYTLSRARNLFIHSGLNAGLLAMIAGGNVYVAEGFVLDLKQSFYKMLPPNTTILAPNGTEYSITYLIIATEEGKMN